MPHSRYIDENGILITTLYGVVTLKELVDLQNELSSYATNKEIYELVVHQDDTELVQNFNESTTSAENLKSIMRCFKKGAIALVSNKNYVYGILRQLQIRVENKYVQMSVFRTEDKALKWLHELKSHGGIHENDI